ncbi:MAG: hypothetical protein ACI9R3_003847 [Verrucomicrobiales bacterium]
MRVILEIGLPDLEDADQAKALDTLIWQVRQHPALYGYYLADEPGAGSFDKLGRIAAFLRERDPIHMTLTCLLPTYASDGHLQVSDDTAARARVGHPLDFAGTDPTDLVTARYIEHLRQFVTTTRSDLICYDHYHFQLAGDGSQYFLNLALVRNAAQAARIPIVNVIQACASIGEGLRGPNVDELRWLTYTSLAYGVQGLAHFRYDTGFWKEPRENITPVPNCWAVSQLNRDFVAIAGELQALKSIGAYHGGELPKGGVAIPADLPFMLEEESGQLLLGYFGETVEQVTHLLVVNKDYRRAQTVQLTVPGQAEIFHAPTNSWRRDSNGLPFERELKLDLPAGGGVLVRMIDRQPD